MDYAFTDQMVRNDKEELTRAAELYLRGYKGSFAPVLAAREALLSGETLNVAEIRTVLNVMRSDTTIRLQYEPPLGNNVVQFPRRDTFAPTYEEERPTRRWYRIPMSIRPEFLYGMSMHKRAEVIHDVSRYRSYAEYFPIGSWHQGRQIWTPRIEFHIKWVCTGPGNNNFRLLTVQEADSLILQGFARVCPACERTPNA